jgi:hypothetical protein
LPPPLPSMASILRSMLQYGCWCSAAKDILSVVISSNYLPNSCTGEKLPSRQWSSVEASWGTEVVVASGIWTPNHPPSCKGYYSW